MGAETIQKEFLKRLLSKTDNIQRKILTSPWLPGSKSCHWTSLSSGQVLGLLGNVAFCYPQFDRRVEWTGTRILYKADSTSPELQLHLTCWFSPKNSKLLKIRGFISVVSQGLAQYLTHSRNVVKYCQVPISTNPWICNVFYLSIFQSLFSLSSIHRCAHTCEWSAIRLWSTEFNKIKLLSSTWVAVTKDHRWDDWEAIEMSL